MAWRPTVHPRPVTATQEHTQQATNNTFGIPTEDLAKDAKQSIAAGWSCPPAGCVLPCLPHVPLLCLHVRAPLPCLHELENTHAHLLNRFDAWIQERCPPRQQAAEACINCAMDETCYRRTWPPRSLVAQPQRCTHAACGATSRLRGGLLQRTTAAGPLASACYYWCTYTESQRHVPRLFEHLPRAPWRVGMCRDVHCMHTCIGLRCSSGCHVGS